MRLRQAEMLANVFEGQAAIERVALVLRAIMEGRPYSLRDAHAQNQYGWYVIKGRSLTKTALGEAYRLAQEEAAG